MLPEEDADFLSSLERAENSPDPWTEVSRLVATRPRSLCGWSTLARHARSPLDRYAYFRLGYHRGLDALRQNGWRGSGFVRWDAAGNVGFLRCLLGLARSAEEIGEADEAERCRLFLQQLDPSGVPPGE